MTSARTTLGPHEYNSKKAQGLVVVLPKKEVTTRWSPPRRGTKTWWSGTGDDLNNTHDAGTVTLPAGPATLSLPDPVQHRGLRLDYA